MTISTSSVIGLLSTVLECAGQRIGALLGGVLLVACLAMPLHGDVTVDDFTEGPFSRQGSAAQPFYETQAVSAPAAVALRSSNVVPLMADAGSVEIEVASGVYGFATQNVPNGALLSLGWFGGLQPGVPPSGSGTLLSSDLTPFSPLLDLTAEAAFVLEYVNAGAAPVSFQIFVYDGSLDDLTIDQSPIAALPIGAGRVVVPFQDVFVNVSPGAIGGLGISLVHDLDHGDLSLLHFTAADPVFGDGFESGSTSAWGTAVP